MNKITIIGNLTKDPDMRSTPQGVSVCSFTVAVNRRQKKENQPDADFFNVTTWRGLADNCGKYLAKGRKVCVIGFVSVNTYKTQNGEFRASIEVNAEDVEFLSPKDAQKVDEQSGYTVASDSGLPWE